MKLGKRLLSLCLSFVMLASIIPAGTVTFAAEGAVSVAVIAVCQAGYSADDYKVAYIVTTGKLDSANENFDIYNGETPVFSGSVADGKMKDEGVVWGKYVYSIDFSDLRDTGNAFTIKSNGATSYSFPIQINVWSGYQQDFMAYYRMQRNADTAALMAMGAYGTKYGSNPLVTKGYHAPAFQDDAWDETKAKHYDLVGGWFDAGDFGIYSENQWVTGQMAITYINNTTSGAVNFDYDGNGIPDMLDEIAFSSEFSLKMIDAFDGYGYNVQKFINNDADDKGQWKHPEKYTDQQIYNGSNTRDDRYVAAASKSVEGSAKMAASLAAAARALRAAIDAGTIGEGDVGTYSQANLNANNKVIDENGNFVENTGSALEPVSFLEACETRALAAYKTAKQFDGRPVGNYPRSNYLATKGLNDPLLWAEVELYLLDPVTYADMLASAKTRIMDLSFNDLQCTNYWNLSSLAMQELYPSIKYSDTELAGKIQSLLESRVNYFISSSDDTPYGVINELGTFGVNEPQMSYVADTIRYYDLFKDINPTLAAQALKAAKKGLYWVFGNNPFSQSWVSGIGTEYVKFIHSRLDENAQSTAPQDGLILPGALVCGPNSKDTSNNNSEYPWYQDRTVQSDGANQWRYNEHSISIQAGIFYTVMTLSGMNDAPVAAEVQDTDILSPLTGSRVDKPANGIVTVETLPKSADVQTVEFALGSENNGYSPMSEEGDGTYTADIDVSGINPLGSQKVVVRTTLNDGTQYYNSTVFIIAPDKIPENGALQQSLNPVLSWGDYPGATEYTLIVSKDSALANPILSQKIASTSYQLNGLQPGMTYYWKVSPDNDILGNATIMSFVTEHTPSEFSLLYPANNAAAQKTSPRFTWAVSDNATDYTLVVADNSNFTNPVFNQNVGNVTSKQISGLDYEKAYYWKVIANGPGGDTISNGGYRTFTTKADPLEAPGSFRLTGPDDAATGLPTDVTLNWSVADDASEYTVVLSTTADYSSPVVDNQSVTENKLSITGLNYGQTYYWKVTANNSSGSTDATNNGASFTIRNYSKKEVESMDLGGTFIVNSLPGANASPEGSVSNNVIRLNSNVNGGTGTASYIFTGAAGLYDISVWYYDENDGINTYKLYLDGVVVDSWTADKDFKTGDPLSQSRTSRIKTQVNVDNGSEIKLESTSVAKSGNYGEWSRSDMIELVSSLRSHIFTPVDDKAVYRGQTLTFNVNAGSGSGNPLIYSSADLPSGAELDQNTGEFSWTPSATGDYTVTFTADDGIISSNMDVQIHVEENPNPREFNLISPATGAEKQSLTPEFKWETSEGADSYTLVVSKNSDLSDPVINETGISGKSFTASTLEYGMTYFWSVIAIDQGIYTEAANKGISFKTVTDPALAVLGEFSLLNPADEATAVSVKPSLSWTASENAESYNVVVSENNDLSAPVINETNVIGTSLTPVTPLAYSKTYYWNVTAVKDTDTLDAANKGISFTTVTVPVRYLGRYANGASERKVSTDWPGDTGKTPQGWGKKWQGTGEMNWSVNFPSAGDYSFTVRASNDGGSAPAFTVRVDGIDSSSAFNPVPGQWTDFSGMLNISTPGLHTLGVYNSSAAPNTNLDIAYIDIFGAAPGGFNLTAPADSAVINTTGATLDWTQTVSGLSYNVFGADEYILVLADNESFINPIVSETTTATTYDVSGLQLNNTYYWKVTTQNVNGMTDCNKTYSFTVAEAPTNLITSTIEAENMVLGNYITENNPFASAGKVVKANGANLTAGVSYTFSEFSGTRDIKIYYFDENDGTVSYKLYVNSTEVGNWTADANLGSANADADTLTSVTFNDINVRKGDIVRIDAIIPAGTSEWGRLDKVEFTFEKPEPAVTSVEVEAMTGTDFPTEAQGAASGGSVRKIPSGQYGAVGSATYTFHLAPGDYNLKVYYFDENDGSASYKVYVNSTAVGQWISNQDLGNSGCTAQTLTSKTLECITLSDGDIIKIEATQQGEEWARTDKLELILPWTESIEYLVAATAGPNGTIEPSHIAVEAGEDVVFTVTSDTGYQVDTVTGGTYNKADGTITVSNVQADCTVAVTFRKVTESSGGDTSNSPASQTPSTPAAPAKPAPVAEIIEVTPVLDKNGTARSGLTSEAFASALNSAQPNSNGIRKVKIEIARVDGVKEYVQQLPVEALTGSSKEQIAIRTEVAEVIVPGNMLAGWALTEASKVEIVVRKADISSLDEGIRKAIGSRPVIEIYLSIDGKVTPWSNPNASVEVSVPYSPTAEEISDPEHIVIWYIDGAGKVTAVPDGRYDAASGTVVFRTNHFSKYAVGFVKKSFKDLTGYSWAKKQIEVMASKGIINGTSSTTFNPGDAITRADFTVLLVDTLGLNAKFDVNFIDVTADRYYYNQIGIARKLGIIDGVGNNKFDPSKKISRQDMMVIAEKAMMVAEKLDKTAKSDDLKRFSDRSGISSYALESVKNLVGEGMITGSGSYINPKAAVTRAESAVLIYRIYNK